MAFQILKRIEYIALKNKKYNDHYNMQIICIVYNNIGCFYIM